MQHFDIFDLEITHSNHMHFSIDSVAASPDISVKRHVNLIVGFVTSVLNCLPAICQNKRMVGSPGNCWRFAVTNIPRHFSNLYGRVHSFVPLVKEKQFTLSSDFILEPFLELLFCFSQLFVFLEEIQMGQNTHYIGETVTFEQR